MGKPTKVYIVLTDDHMDYYRGTTKQAQLIMEHVDDYSISTMPADFMTPDEIDELPMLSALLDKAGVRYG